MRNEERGMRNEEVSARREASPLGQGLRPDKEERSDRDWEIEQWLFGQS